MVISSCPTDWLSGGTGETPSPLSHISGKTRLRASGASRCPLEPVFGGVLIKVENVI